MAQFSLVAEPFVPCLLNDGTTVELSLRDALVRAGEVAELRDGSPLVTVALHRLLLAILHSVYDGPKTREGRIEIISAGQFDAKRIDAYLAMHEDRFDLFHPQFPFYQAAGFRTKEPSGINRLAQELSRGNNAALFDHTIDEPPPAFTPAQAARVVIAEQVFAVGGGKSDTGNTTHAPLVAGAIVVARGDTLFQTLCLNLTIFDRKRKPIAGDESDAPVWEAKTPMRPDQCSQLPNGYLDYLTWQTRTLCLHPEEYEDGRIIVRRVSYAQGRRFVPEDRFFDSMIAYRKDEKAGFPPVRFSEYRDLWRESAALFQFGETDQFKGPETLETLRHLPETVLPRAKRYRLITFGLCTDKAKVNYWRAETLPLRLAYLESPQLVASLQNSLGLAEAVARQAIRPAVWAAASDRLTGGEGGNPDTERVSAVIDSLATDRHYWSRLERPFRELLVDLAKDVDRRDDCVRTWFVETLGPAAKDAFRDTVERLDGGRDLKAVNAGRRVLHSRLAEILRKDVPNVPTPGGPS